MINKIYQWLREPGEKLSQRVLHGGFWLFTLRLLNRGFSFGRTVVLARLLAPNDFGLFGLATLTLSVLQNFSQTGFESALIQKKKDIRPYLDSAWSLQVLRGILITIVLVLCAPAVAVFFEEPRVTPLLRVIGVAVLLGSFKNIGIVFFKKEISFQKEFAFQFSGTIADIMVAIPIAIWLRSVWALIFGLLAGNFSRLVVSYYIHPYRPSFEFNWRKSKELFEYGRWISGSSIMVFLYSQGDDIFVGKYLGATALGLYQIAYKISNLPASEITHLISRVTFPAYSKLQDNLPRLQNAYFKILQVTTFISIPIAFGIAFLARDFTRIFLGQQWLTMVPAVQILAIWGGIRSAGAHWGPLYKSINRPDIGTKLQFIKVILLFLMIYPFTSRWGIVGTSLAVVLNALVVFPIHTVILQNMAGISIRKFYKLIGVPIVLSFAMLTLLWTLKSFVFKPVDTVDFFLLVISGTLIYFFLSETLTGYLFNYNVRKTIMENMGGFSLRAENNP